VEEGKAWSTNLQAKRKESTLHGKVAAAANIRVGPDMGEEKNAYAERLQREGGLLVGAGSIGNSNIRLAYSTLGGWEASTGGNRVEGKDSGRRPGRQGLGRNHRGTSRRIQELDLLPSTAQREMSACQVAGEGCGTTLVFIQASLWETLEPPEEIRSTSPS